MKSLENSLCNSCEHFENCKLTNDRRFIWSCSEYKEEASHGQKERKSITNTEINFPVSEIKPELV